MWNFRNLLHRILTSDTLKISEEPHVKFLCKAPFLFPLELLFCNSSLNFDRSEKTEVTKEDWELYVSKKTLFNNISVCCNNCLNFQKKFVIIFKINHALNGKYQQDGRIGSLRASFLHGDINSTVIHKPIPFCEKYRQLRACFTPDKHETSCIKGNRKIHSTHLPESLPPAQCSTVQCSIIEGTCQLLASLGEGKNRWNMQLAF